MRLFAVRVRAHARAVGGRVDVHVHPRARLRGRVNVFVVRGARTRFELGPDGVIERGTLLHFGGGRISVGPNVHLRAHSVLRVAGGELVFAGDNVLSYGAVVHCDERVEVGRRTIVGEHVTIADTNHVRTDDPDDWFIAHVTSSPVVIGERCWVGAKATVAAGVTIGDDTFVGANAVVTGDLPAGVNAAGIPARVLERRSPHPTRS